MAYSTRNGSLTAVHGENTILEYEVKINNEAHFVGVLRCLRRCWPRAGCFWARFLSSSQLPLSAFRTSRAMVSSCESIANALIPLIVASLLFLITFYYLFVSFSLANGFSFDVEIVNGEVSPLTSSRQPVLH